MSGRLIGKVALVSGGARGMGASHVRAMVAEGAKVVFGDILDEEGKAVAAELADAARSTPISKRGWAKTSMSGRNAATSVARIGRPVGESYQAS